MLPLHDFRDKEVIAKFLVPPSASLTKSKHTHVIIPYIPSSPRPFEALFMYQRALGEINMKFLYLRNPAPLVQLHIASHSQPIE